MARATSIPETRKGASCDRLIDLKENDDGTSDEDFTALPAEERCGQHGLARAAYQGYIAGNRAAKQPASAG